VLALTGCSGLSAPTEQNIAGLSPSDNVTITADFVAGLGVSIIRAGISIQTAGKCFRPWRVAKINASGEAYKLASVAEFPGSTRQSTGAAGSSTSGGSDLWLQNSAGVIMHLQGTSTGAMLPLGRDEIFIRMVQ
jgi:hypothetical protein